MSAEIVRFETRGNVGLIVHDDGKVNAQGPAFVAGLGRALDQAEEAAVRAVVLMGRPGVLGAGLDLKALPKLDAAARRDFAAAFCAVMVRAFAFPKPLVTVGTGHALAGGAVALLTGDVRLQCRGDFKIGLVEVPVGIAFPAPILEICRKALPSASHAPAILHGRSFDPDGALAVGFATELVYPDAALDRALAVAGELAALPADAYAGTKEELRGLGARRALERLDAERFAADIAAARRGG